jgi:hypothetical protein
MWQLVMKLRTISGAIAEVKALFNTRQEAVSFMKDRFNIVFAPTDFFNRSADYEEAEAMFIGNDECVWLTRLHHIVIEEA